MTTPLNENGAPACKLGRRIRHYRSTKAILSYPPQIAVPCLGKPRAASFARNPTSIVFDPFVYLARDCARCISPHPLVVTAPAYQFRRVIPDPKRGANGSGLLDTTPGNRVGS